MDCLLHHLIVLRPEIPGDDDSSPDGNPVKNPMIRKVRLPPELTAAKASLSAKFPTTQASAIL